MFENVLIDRYFLKISEYKLSKFTQVPFCCKCIYSTKNTNIQYIMALTFTVRNQNTKKYTLKFLKLKEEEK
jgi:hypothetical protein